MKAFLFVTDPAALWLELANNRSPASLPYLDRGLMQHAIESLVSRDVKEFEIVAFVTAERISSLVQGGTRWGASIHVTSTRNWSEIQELMVAKAQGEAILVANAERLPDIAQVALDQPGVFLAPNGATCWAVVKPSDFQHVPAVINGEVPDGLAKVSVPYCLNVSTPADYLEGWDHVVGREMPLLVQTGRDRSPGVVIGRGARVDPSATLTAPCYVGENTIIGRGCQIGPRGYVCSNCILEEDTSVSDTVILPGSYVGANLELKHKVAARSSILDLVRKLVVPVSDDVLFGSTNLSSRQGPSAAERGTALIAAIVLSPIWAIGYLAGRLTPLGEREIGYASPTKDLFCRTLPGLLSVAAGKARLVGAPNLSARAVQSMEPDIRRALVAVPKGIVSETYLLYGPKPTDEDLWASSAFQAAGKTLGSASDVFGRYLKMALSGQRPNWQA